MILVTAWGLLMLATLTALVLGTQLCEFLYVGFARQGWRNLGCEESSLCASQDVPRPLLLAGYLSLVCCGTIPLKLQLIKGIGAKLPPHAQHIVPNPI